MWKFIKDLPTATRGQKALSAVASLIVVGGMVTVGGNVFRHFRTADLRVNPLLFDEGRIENGRYIHDALGWEMAIPAGWELTPTRSAAENRRIADMVKEDGITDSVISAAKELVSFRKNPHNKFFSSVEPADGGSYDELIEAMMPDNFGGEDIDAQTGMKTVTDNPRREEVGGVVFYTQTSEITIAARQEKYWTVSYYAIIDDRLLSVVIVYDNPQSKFELLEAWRGSMFRPVGAAQ